MRKKILEIGLVVLGVISLVVAINAYFQNKRPKPLSQTQQKESLIVRAIIREFDCVQCTQKMLCYWSEIEIDMASQRINTQVVFAIEDRANFKREELELLCPMPQGLEFNDYEAIKQWSTFPISTPAIMVTNNVQILYMELIFLNTDMTAVHQHLNEVLANALPQARIITGLHK